MPTEFQKNGRRLVLNEAVRTEIRQMAAETEGARITRVLGALGIATSSCYRRPIPEEVYRVAHSITNPRWQAWAKGAKEKLDKMLAEAA